MKSRATERSGWGGGPLQKRDVILCCTWSWVSLRGPKVTELRPMQKEGAGEAGPRLGQPSVQRAKGAEAAAGGTAEGEAQGQTRAAGAHPARWKLAVSWFYSFVVSGSSGAPQLTPQLQRLSLSQTQAHCFPRLSRIPWVLTIWGRGRVQTGVSVALEGGAGSFRGLACLGSQSM